MGEDTQHEKSRYSPSVRLGNWFEEATLFEEKLKAFGEKRRGGDLFLQKGRDLFSNMLAKVNMKDPTDYLEYGVEVQIFNKNVPSSPSHKEKGIYLSVLVSERETGKVTHFVDGCVMTGSPFPYPCARNVFKFIPMKPEEGETHLKYGDIVYITTLSGTTGEPFYLSSELARLNADFGESQHVTVRIQKSKDRYCRWQLLHPDIDKRHATNGQLIKPNTELLIMNVATSQNLSVEPRFWTNTFFGQEVEISTYTYKNDTVVLGENLWTLKVDPQDIFPPLVSTSDVHPAQDEGNNVGVTCSLCPCSQDGHKPNKV